MAQDQTQEEIDLLTKQITANNETILNLTAENRCLENTVALLKLKQRGILNDS